MGFRNYKSVRIKTTLDNCLTSDNAPVFNNAVNTTFEIFDSGSAVDTEQPALQTLIVIQ